MAQSIEGSHWSRSILLYQRGSPLTDLFKRHFETTKLLRTQFREHSLHLPGMLSKGRINEGFAAWSEGNDPHAPVFGALDPADQALREETAYSSTDRPRGQIDDRTYSIDGQWALKREDPWSTLCHAMWVSRCCMGSCWPARSAAPHSWSLPPTRTTCSEF